MQVIGKIPLLSKEEEKTIIPAAQNGDNAARNRAIESNLRLVISISKKFQTFCSPGLSFWDLVEEGNIGLMTALERYDTSFDTRFSTYASHWIKQTIRKAILNQRHTIRVPIATQTKSNDYDIENAPTEIIRDALRAKTTLSLDIPTIIDDALGIRDESNKEREIEANKNNNIILCHQAIKQLEKRKKYVIKCRYFKNMTLKEVGEVLGISRERVRQIEEEARSDMKEFLNGSIVFN